MLINKSRFYVRLQGKKRSWQNQRSDLPQGSLLAPIIFNIYTNDQPTNLNTKHFLSAVDFAISSQKHTFKEVKKTDTRSEKDVEVL